MTQSKFTIYGDSRSGNCYKIQLLCAELEIEYDWHEVDILARDTHTPEFLAMNANGKIPLLVLPDGRCLPESNAILYYLAEDSELFAGDTYSRANILSWMCFEQYSHEPNIATSRFIIQYLGNPADKLATLAEKKPAGIKALDIMEQQLNRNDYITGETYNISDIALFAYTHVAEEGGFSLDPYPGIRAWIERIMQRPKFVAITQK